MSPLTLRRRYMPRTGKGARPPQAHPQAAAAAAETQVQHVQAPPRSQRKTENTATSHRTTRIKLTPFKKGFEMETEHEVAKAFCRPPRHFKEDPPFYPWLPCVPKVQFKLNFKG